MFIFCDTKVTPKGPPLGGSHGIQDDQSAAQECQTVEKTVGQSCQVAPQQKKFMISHLCDNFGNIGRRRSEVRRSWG